MIMTRCLVESWNEVILINTKCQGTGVEKRPQKKKEEKNSRGSKFNLVAFLS